MFKLLNKRLIQHQITKLSARTSKLLAGQLFVELLDLDSSVNISLIVERYDRLTTRKAGSVPEYRKASPSSIRNYF